MPTGKHAKTGKSTVETIFTVLHAWWKIWWRWLQSFRWSNMVLGRSVVNALSSWLEVNVYRDGKEYYQRFENGGTPVAPLKRIRTYYKQGTKGYF